MRLAIVRLLLRIERQCLRKELDDMMQGIICITTALQTQLLIYTCCSLFIAVASGFFIVCHAFKGGSCILMYALVYGLSGYRISAIWYHEHIGPNRLAECYFCTYT